MNKPKRIPGFAGYFVDRQGKVWSGKGGRYGRWKSLHPIRPWIDRGGYERVTLGIPRRGAPVHRLVAAAYLGPCPEGLVCEHINGNKRDNRPENLRYVTQAENLQRKASHGTAVLGQRSHLAKLTDSQARKILRQCLEGGKTFRAIAKAFGVHETTVSAIRTGRIRKHLWAGIAPVDPLPPIGFTGTAAQGELRDVPGFATYKVDFAGNVWSFWDGPRNRWPVRNKLRPRKRRDGYLEFAVRKNGGPIGAYTRVQAHRLVALAWLGPRPSGYVIHHRNGKRSDNRVANLEYVSVWGNARHRALSGLQQRGEDCAKGRLTEADALEILRILRDGELSQREIARRFHVGVAAVWSLKTGRTWKHLPR